VKRREVKISEARQRLFELVEQVTSGDEPVVYIEHRDREHRAALVSEAHLRYLEARAAAAGGAPFTLAGSMTLLVGEEELEQAISADRAEQSRLAREKFRDLDE